MNKIYSNLKIHPNLKKEVQAFVDDLGKERTFCIQIKRKNRNTFEVSIVDKKSGRVFFKMDEFEVLIGETLYLDQLDIYPEIDLF